MAERFNIHEQECDSALAAFRRAITARWPTLTAAQRKELGETPDHVVQEIRSRAELVGKEELTVPRSTVDGRRQRLGEHAVAHGTGVPALPHLDPDGPLAEREANGFARNEDRRIPLRQMEDISVALGPFFEVRNLQPLLERTGELRGTLERLKSTPLGQRAAVSTPKGGHSLASVLDSLRWCETVFLPHVTALAEGAGKRKLPGTRRLAVSLLVYVKAATGRDQFAKVAHVLNWLVPTEDEGWTARSLARWKREYQESEAGLVAQPAAASASLPETQAAITKSTP